MQKEIVISRMFTGKYLEENIGHEAINMFRPDSEKGHYIYLNDDGKFDKKHVDKNSNELLIENVILTKPIGNNAVEVIGMASGLEMKYNPTCDQDEIRKEQKKIGKRLKYAGRTLEEIFSGEEQVLVTFKATKVLKPANGICIVYAQKKNAKKSPTIEWKMYYEKVVELENTHLGRELKNYVCDDGGKDSDYSKLKGLVSNKALWEDTIGNVLKREIKPPTFIEICRRSYDELAYSNMIYHYLSSYPKLLKPFVEMLRRCDQTIEVKQGERFEIHREYHPQSEKEKSRSPIDLYIKFGDRCIIIENKIKAEIGSLKSDGKGNQLTRYVDMVKKYEGLEINKIHCFLLTPEYRKINLSKLSSYKNKQNKSKLDKYKSVTYKQLYEFFCKHKNVIEKESCYEDFLDALKLHADSKDNQNYRIMMRRLVRK